MWGQNITYGLSTNDQSALFHILMFFTCAKITINFYYTMIRLCHKLSLNSNSLLIVAYMDSFIHGSRVILTKIQKKQIISRQIVSFNIHLVTKSGFFRVLLAVSFIFFLLFHKKVLFLQSGILYTDGFTSQRLS